jgi:hypothetical protein
MTANLMESGSEWLYTKLIAHASETVTYTFKATSGTVDVSAVIAETRAETITDEGTTQVQVRNIDFLIRAADLLDSGSPVAPQQGDRILRSDVNGTAVTFEVLKVNAQKQFRESDRFGLTYRIHTKEVIRT